MWIKKSLAKNFAHWRKHTRCVLNVWYGHEIDVIKLSWGSELEPERMSKADIWTNFMSLYHCYVLFYLFSNESYFTGIGIFYYLLQLYFERITMRRLCSFSFDELHIDITGHAADPRISYNKTLRNKNMEFHE